MSMYSVVFAGTPIFACPSLSALLLDLDFEVKMVITQPDKPAGRTYTMTTSPIKALAGKNNILIQQPQKISDIKEKITELNPDFMVVVAYGKILPESILTIPRCGAINVHASLLPKFRGASPIQSALLQGENETGVTFQLMNKFLDQGDILYQKRVHIENDETYLGLSEKLSRISAQYLPEVLKNFAKATIKPEPQDHTSATYCRKIIKEDGLLDFKTESAGTMVLKIRAFTPWPGCFTFYNNKRIKIISASASEQKIDTEKWLLLDKKTVGVGTISGTLLPLLLQPEGKKIMTAEEFIRGYFKAVG